jgi:protein O-mannosyl-transferase
MKWLAVILVAYVALFARAATYDFVWDDVQEIATNPAFDRPLVDGLTTTQTERTDPELTQLSTIQLAYDSYRPLLFASYWVDIRLWGRSATALHVVNLVLGALAIALAYLVARRWTDSQAIAVIATAVFALHPAQIETVAYISARGDLLAGTLALAATYAALRGWRAACAAAFAASLLTKEAYIGLPLALAVLQWLRGGVGGAYSPPNDKPRWSLLGALGGVAAAYFVVRALVVTATTGGALGHALVALPGVWLEYVKVALLPFDLSTERLHRAAFTVPGWIVWAAGGAGLWLVRKRAPAAVAGVAWFAILLGPAAVPVTSTGVVADRYLYAPLLGLALAVALAGQHALAARPKLRLPLVAAGVLWALLLAVIAWIQVPVWRDNRALYTHAVEMAPDSSAAHYRIAYLDVIAGDCPSALPELERAVELDEGNVRAWNNLGVCYLRTQRYADAEPALLRAVTANPAHFRAWFNLGVARLALGKRADGCAALRRALAIRPNYDAATHELRASCPP